MKRICKELVVTSNQVDCRKDTKISTNDLLKMAAFILKNKYFEFNREVKYQYQGLLLVQNLLPYMAPF